MERNKKSTFVASKIEFLIDKRVPVCNNELNISLAITSISIISIPIDWRCLSDAIFAREKNDEKERHKLKAAWIQMVFCHLKACRWVIILICHKWQVRENFGYSTNDTAGHKHIHCVTEFILFAFFLMIEMKFEWRICKGTETSSDHSKHMP